MNVTFSNHGRAVVTTIRLNGKVVGTISRALFSPKEHVLDIYGIQWRLMDRQRQVYKATTKTGKGTIPLKWCDTVASAKRWAELVCIANSDFLLRENTNVR